ncbi:hypothetical protein [Nostoc sp. FACHB-888]|uniref:hypothetical protein n=1 Tax=Nostoc sp. FACHB-888 TaxID=2692842 RepID=UPI001688CCAA|nr:hypothetical protein [Nostoc sp. FACHB-888]MBD2247358.1 hypothetical protein [Nostoc sp. FACHB-888]
MLQQRADAVVPQSDILHHSQQDLKNRVYQRRIKVSRLQQSQETRFSALVQDMSKEKRHECGNNRYQQIIS